MAGIIKSGVWQGSASTFSAASFNFEDITQQADQYLASVRRQAAQIVSQAKAQVAAIEAQACERGQQQARQQAERFAQDYTDKRLQTLLPALEQAIQSIQHSRATWLRHWEANTVQLAAAIAERIVRRELSQHPEISLAWIREALELVTGESRVTLHLHPTDYETLGMRAEQLITSLTKVGTAAVMADPTVEPGGCRITTDFGSIDQQLTAQLERIKDDLTSD